MPREDITSFNVSGNLKTALENAGFGNETRPESGRAFYNGTANIRLLCLEQPANIEGLRTIEISNNTPDFDFVDFSDPTVTRFWTIRELEIFVGTRIPGVQASESTLSGTTWTHVIQVNDVDYTATDTKQVDAMAKALRAYLQANAQQLRQG